MGMGSTTKGLAVLGSTGSIGTQTLDIVRTFADEFSVVGLAARRNHRLLERQIREFRPSMAYCEGSEYEKAFLGDYGCADCEIEEIAASPEVDIVVAATSGDVAVPATFAGIEAGKDIALANKETVVVAGELVTQAVREHNVSLLPLDSEPNAIWQCLRGEDKDVSKLIITASGGAFRDTPLDSLADVTLEQALQHPTWQMGAKITVDSATMMNKAFEVIEAHWLFDVPWEDIEVVVHPQSMIHSMVEFVDGSVKAQISPPDMRLPIQYALFYPRRLRNPVIKPFDPIATSALSFEPLDFDRYPCFRLALEVAQRGGTWPAALCGADDAAVELFLAGKIGFMEIQNLITEALREHQNIEEPTLQEALDAAADARRRAAGIVEV